MRLDFIDLGNIDDCPQNMRSSRRAPDVTDILPTVRKRGILVPVIVRPGPTQGRFELVAGRRRVHAARIALAEDGADPDLSRVPAAIMDADDDASALEASLIENLARLDPDEVTQWETFVRLVKQGRGIDDIAATFGLPDLTVRRVLALGNLLPRVRDLYRAEKIDAATVRHLTLATKSQQKAWLALIDDPDGYAPTGHQLKAWLFGGQAIPVRHALFDVEAFPGTILGDLFGEDRYFADADAFWTAQNAAIEARRLGYLDDGWSDAVIVPPGEYFQSYEHERAQKRKGGRVYIVVRGNGEVVLHEGYLTRKEAKRLEKGGLPEPEKTARPELTSTLQTYVDLHRHAAVRAAMIGHPAVAFRLMVAHAIVGSHLWSARPDPQTARGDATTESLETSLGEARFDEHRRAVLALLDFSPDEPTVTGGNGDEYGMVGVFLRLLGLSDAAVMDVVTIVMGETLAVGSAAVDALGAQLRVDMADWWQADDALFELLRDREVLGALVAEVAGEPVAKANANGKGKVLKQIVRDHLDGTEGRTKVKRWVPRWMAFPPSAYTTRGGVGTVAAQDKVEAARAASAIPAPEQVDVPAQQAA
jgi:ParB family chromosome partitioning protein